MIRSNQETGAGELSESAALKIRRCGVREFMRRRPVLLLVVAIAISLASLVSLILVLSRGLPPRTVVMTTGPEGGAFQAVGERYRAALARDGIRLELKPSLGNLENLARLNDPSSGVSVGFVASGLTTESASPGIESLGTISYEPIWIFCHGLPEEAQFGDLRGKRVSIDPHAGIMLDLLRAMGLEKDGHGRPARARRRGRGAPSRRDRLRVHADGRRRPHREEAPRRRAREPHELPARGRVRRPLSRISPESPSPGASGASRRTSRAGT